MEGVSSEAASFAGHQQLANLCWIYDNNHITIDGRTEITYTDDVATRFMGYGWNVLRVGDANDLDLLANAFEAFRAEERRPTLIIVDSHIGYGSPHKQDTAAAHGEPLGEEEVRETKRAYGWPEDAEFLVPDGVYEHFAAGIGARGEKLRAEWEEAHGLLPARARRRSSGGSAAMQHRELPDGLGRRHPLLRRRREGHRHPQGLERGPERDRRRGSRGCSCGSADLTGSTSVELSFDGAEAFEPGRPRRPQLHYGIREHESAAISNGLSLSKLRPVWSTYLVFSDYARPAIRLSALMELPVIHVFTHDSIGLGEDGPTHQPVEHLASLRAIPGLNVIRPCDANEVAEAWRVTMEPHHQPVALVLTRQDVPVLDRSRVRPRRGPAPGRLRARRRRGRSREVILIATGSEVALAVAAHEQLIGEGCARASSACPRASCSTASRRTTARASCRRR